MKKIFSVLITLIVMLSLFPIPAFADTRNALNVAQPRQQSELGQLKVCKVAGAGVTPGKLFTIKVGDTSYSVPAGPADGGYCVLAGQFPLNTQVTVQEVIPAGYFVASIDVKVPDRAVSKDLSLGKAVVKVGSGVTEVIFTNKAGSAPTSTPTPLVTSTPTLTKTPTPVCTNCTPTPTPIPTGRLQICKEADGSGVSGYFTFKYGSKTVSVPVGACSSLLFVNAGSLTITEVAQSGYAVTGISTIPADRLVSKSLANRSVTVTIVEGYASSQTIAVFRNRAQGTVSTPTSTPTNTPTGTITPATSTPTPTNTPTGTITPATSTPTPTNTPTGTITPATFTPTPTNTPTGTITPATSTPTPTFTPTGTITPVCTPIVFTANFSSIPAGQSVEGLGAVLPNLNIDAIGTAISIRRATEPLLYLGIGSGTPVINDGVPSTGGFSDLTTQQATQAHMYTFTFAPGATINEFSLHMEDFGDLNPTLSTNHYASMTAYDVNGIAVAIHELSYTTLPEINPASSNLYGDLRFSGDATRASPGQPGNWTWHVSGNGIVRVVLEFGVGFDPNIGFDLLSFATECQLSCTPSVIGGFSKLPAGQSVEGLGVVAPGLNIDAKGTAISILRGIEPLLYLGLGSGTPVINDGVPSTGGFSDLTTQQAAQAHMYTFTFSPGMTVNDFSLHMEDFGDLNPTLAMDHFASMTAYDANGAIVSSQVLSYTTPPEVNPTSSNIYGDLAFSGDATRALPGQPGNWTWHVSGNGIVRVVLQFGVGFDPNIGFDNLIFTKPCP